MIIRHWNNTPIAALPIFIFSGRNVNLERVLKAAIVTSLASLVVIILSAKLGIITDHVGVSQFRIRHYLGFTYILFPSAIFFNITAMIIYIYKDKLKLTLLMLLLLGNYYFYVMTRSNLSFYLAVVLIILSFFARKNNFKSHFAFLSCFSYIIFFVISYLIIRNYSPSNLWMYHLNLILENRIALGQESLDLFGIHLFGSDVQWQGFGLDFNNGVVPIGNYLYVDNFYINILQQYGIIYTFLFILFLTILLFKSYKKKNYYMVIILSMFAIHGLIDDLMDTLYYNTFLLAIGTALFKTTDMKQKSIVKVVNKLKVEKENKTEKKLRN
ncbi:hypothetical protein [Liquorilactobacillus aquaticus]|nr:hypothetical protein [Liquorilactobacillus aquaticus]